MKYHPVIMKMFERKPELLDEPCVQDLINYMIIKHKAQSKAINDLTLQETELMRCCMESNFVVEGGHSCKEAIRMMMNIFEKYC